MTFGQRRALSDRSDTEALLGDRVVIVRLRPDWAEVVVPSQPSQKDSRGYPGWVPRRQLTARTPTRTGQVATVTSRTAWLRTHDAAIAPSRASLSRTAKSFLGLPYLWGGLSGFGIDCSGLTWLDYRVHGIRIPRDALPQSRHGRYTSTRSVGDLLFYASNGLVHHVSMYIGGGYMIHAPRTGEAVQIVPFSQQPLRSEYAGARRYLS